MCAGRHLRQSLFTVAPSHVRCARLCMCTEHTQARRATHQHDMWNGQAAKLHHISMTVHTPRPPHSHGWHSTSTRKLQLNAMRSQTRPPDLPPLHPHCTTRLATDPKVLWTGLTHTLRQGGRLRTTTLPAHSLCTSQAMQYSCVTGDACASCPSCATEPHGPGLQNRCLGLMSTSRLIHLCPWRSRGSLICTPPLPTPPHLTLPTHSSTVRYTH